MPNVILLQKDFKRNCQTEFSTFLKNLKQLPVALDSHLVLRVRYMLLSTFIG